MADILNEINEVKAEIALAESERLIARRDGKHALVLAYTTEISELLRKEDRLSRSPGNATLPDHNIYLFEYK
jgi:hypothetical protein